MGGVAVIDPSGSIETLSPSEAAASPILDNQQLYPEQLALQSVAATKYRNGILNTYTSHEDEIEIAPLPGDRNDQPFFILSESGPQYVVAVEPYGDAQGLKELWTIDGQSGAFERYVPADSLFGPQRAADLVRQSAPQTDWGPLFAGRADPYSHRRSRVLASTRRPRGQQRDCVCRICRRTVR